MPLWLAAALFLLPPLAAGASPTPAPDGALVYILAPADGSTVTAPVTVVFGLAGMGIAPAGVERPGTGHHHLLIDLDPAEVDMTATLPAYEQLVHFGGGQTQATLELPPGEHRLQLLLGDHDHVPHMPPILSGPITIVVE